MAGQGLFLRFLEENGGEATKGELEAELGVSSNSVYVLSRALKRQGLIRSERRQVKAGNSGRVVVFRLSGGVG